MFTALGRHADAPKRGHTSWRRVQAMQGTGSAWRGGMSGMLHGKFMVGNEPYMDNDVPPLGNDDDDVDADDDEEEEEGDDHHGDDNDNMIMMFPEID